ncbi:MAG: hypothetical protein ACYC6L_14505, partial [Anaerolineae bacterium]
MTVSGQRMKTWLYRARFPLLAGAFYLIYTLVLLYPVSLHMRTLLPGFATDTYQHLWIMWWYRQALAVLHINPNNLVTLFAPDGMVNPLIGTSPLPYLLAIPLQVLLGTITTYNLLLILSFPLCGLAMYALARDLGISHAGAFVAGFIFSFFPAKTIHLAGHYLQFHIYWLPLYVLFLLRLFRQPSWKNGALCGLFLGLSVLSHMVHAAQFVLPITALIFIYALLARWRMRNWAFWTRLALAGGLALAIILPFYGPYIFDVRRYALEMQPGGVDVYNPDLLAYLVPHIWHPLSSIIPALRQLNLDLVPAGGYYIESAGYMGIFALGLALAGVFKGGRRTWLWLLVALTGAVLALGPLLHINGQLVQFTVDQKTTFIPLPYLLISKLPLLNVGRTPGRSTTLAMFGLALLAGYGVSKLGGRGRPWLRRAALAVLTLALAFDYFAWPLPHFSSPVPEYFKTMAASQGGAVLKFPAFLAYEGALVDAPNLNLFDQMNHGRPVNDGYLYRWDPVLRNKTLDLDELFMPERDRDIIDYPAGFNPGPMLTMSGYEYVIIRKPYSGTMPPEVRSQYEAYEWKGTLAWPELNAGADRARELFGPPVYEDASVRIYHIPPASKSDPGSAWLYLADGWGWVTYPEDTPARLLVGNGSFVVEANQVITGRTSCM